MVEDDVFKESQDVFQFNEGINLDNTINLDDFSKSFGLGNPPLYPIFVNLSSDFDFTTPMKPCINPTHGTIGTCLAHATIPTPRSTGIKRKRSLILIIIIEYSNKNSKVIVDAMDWINRS